jgi:hypothetical protein
VLRWQRLASPPDVGSSEGQWWTPEVGRVRVIDLVLMTRTQKEDLGNPSGCHKRQERKAIA